MMSLTHHAQIRLQQRGIPSFVIDRLLDVGCHQHDHRGGTVIYFDHRSRDQLRRESIKNDFKKLERHLDVYAVVGIDGSVVTVGHRTHRINRS